MKNMRNKDCELMKTFSQNMTYYRKAAGLTKKELAENTRLSCPFIDDLEAHTKGASFETIERIAAALNIAPFFLFINPKDRFNGENHKLIGILNAIKSDLNNFFDHTIKDFLK